MRLSFDLDLQKFVIQGTSQVVTSIEVKRSPNTRIEIQFFRANGVTPIELSSGATGVFEVKESGKYDANSVFRAGSWVKTGTGVDTLYTFTMDVQTAGGDLILGAEDPVTVTATAATDLLNAVAHGLILGNIVQFSTTTTLPAPLLENRDYYVVAPVTADAFKVALTAGGTAIDITDTGTGTHKFRKINDDVASANLMCAMQYVADGNTVESNTMTFVYQNDVVRAGDTSPVADPEDVIVAVRAGVDSITNGTDTGAVTFTSPFASGSVVPQVTVLIPNGGDKIFAVVDFSTLTTGGFTYFLSATVPATGYKLSYLAVAT